MPTNFDNTTPFDRFGLRPSSLVITASASLPGESAATCLDNIASVVDDVTEALPSCDAAACEGARDEVRVLVNALRRELLEMRTKVARDIDDNVVRVTLEDVADELDGYIERLKELDGALDTLDTEVRATVDGLDAGHKHFEQLTASVERARDHGVTTRANAVRAVFRANFGTAARGDEPEGIYALRRAIDDLHEVL